MTMLQDFIDKGLKFSQNPIFRTIAGRAGGIMAKPVKVAMLLTTAYGKLVDLDSSRSGVDQVKEVMQTFMRLVKAYANGSYRQSPTGSYWCRSRRIKLSSYAVPSTKWWGYRIFIHHLLNRPIKILYHLIFHSRYSYAAIFCLSFF